MRSTRSTIPSIAFASLMFAACAVTTEDIDTWTGTVRGPGKIVAVLLADKYADPLRVHAGLALIRMEPRQEVDGVSELQGTVRRLDEDTRRRIVDGMTPGLLELMRGEGQPPVAEGSAPPALQIRAKDAAFLILQYASPEQQSQLTEGVVGWFVEDFNGRSLAGNFSAEQVVRQLGAPGAQRLIDAMSARIPQQALVKIAELIASLGSPETKQRAGERLVQIERELESGEFGTWLAERVRTQMSASGGTVDEARVNAAVALNREQFITLGALPAMHHLADQTAVSNRLLEMATATEGTNEERRVVALQAMEGHVRADQTAPLLALALQQSQPTRVRDYAFDRIADSRSREVIPQLWPLATSADKAQWRQRWRVGALILTLGGPEVVTEWLGRLPAARDVEYAREELAGYATRIAAMRPAPDALMLAQLSSPNWWNRAIALYYLERQGNESHLARLGTMASDSMATRGEHWEAHDTIGKIATDVMTAIRERMAAGSPPAAGAGGSDGGGASGGGGTAG